RCSRPRAAFSWRAFSALVERVISHKYITIYDVDQVMGTFLATPQLFFQTGNYLLCKGRDHSSLRSALRPWSQPPILFLHWRFQPALDIEDYPPIFGMFLDCPHQ